MKVPVRGRQLLLKTKHFLPENVIWPALPNQYHPKKFNSWHSLALAENGRLLQHADKLLKRAMDKYWKNTTESGAWHFVKKRGELMCTKSKVFSRLVTKKYKLGLMNE